MRSGVIAVFSLLAIAPSCATPSHTEGLASAWSPTEIESLLGAWVSEDRASLLTIARLHDNVRAARDISVTLERLTVGGDTRIELTGQVVSVSSKTYLALAVPAQGVVEHTYTLVAHPRPNRLDLRFTLLPREILRATASEAERYLSVESVQFADEIQSFRRLESGLLLRELSRSQAQLDRLASEMSALDDRVKDVSKTCSERFDAIESRMDRNR